MPLTTLFRTTLHRSGLAATVVSLALSAGACSKSSPTASSASPDQARVESSAKAALPQATLDPSADPERAALYSDCALSDGRAKPHCDLKYETALLAGGCFWGMEEILRGVPGVVDTEVGYAGGKLRQPGYEDVKKGNTGHAETVRVVFDPQKISFEELLTKWFFRMHDPTTSDRQGNDIGSQYRSAIFATTASQIGVATKVKKAVDGSGKWSDPLVTEIVKANPFTPAEDYHQDYLDKDPGGYTCHYMRD